MNKLAYSLISSFALAGMLASVPSTAQAQTFRFEARVGPRTPLRGQRYETMRALAHYLDEEAQHLSRAVSVGAGYSRRQAYLQSDIAAFTQQASGFHDQLDAYAARPWELRPQIAALDDQARRIEFRLRRARVFPHTYQDWAAVRDVLNRMNQVLAGYDVQVPPAHRPYDDGYYDDGYRHDDDRRDHRWNRW